MTYDTTARLTLPLFDFASERVTRLNASGSVFSASSLSSLETGDDVSEDSKRIARLVSERDSWKLAAYAASISTWAVLALLACLLAI